MRRVFPNGAFAPIFRIIQNDPIHQHFRCIYYTPSTATTRAYASATSFSYEDSEEFLRWRNGGGKLHKLAQVDPSAVIEVGAVVHPEAVLAADVRVGSGTIVGPGVAIGKCTWIGCNVALSNCSVGDLCAIHNGVCIGQDGFGFYVDEKGNMVKKPQLLNAKIGNHVEISANTCIDRGSWRETVIGDHSKLDNLVQIGHNVVIGRNCMLCGQVGIAGSVTIGDYVTLGGRVAIRDHISIGSKVRLAANSCVTKDIRNLEIMEASLLFQLISGVDKLFTEIGCQRKRSTKITSEEMNEAKWCVL